MKIEYQILSFMQRNCALYFAGYCDEDANIIDTVLSEYNFAEIPDDYRRFLTFINGVTFDGLMFFGTKPQERKSKNYIFPSILSVNMEHKDLDFFQNKIIVGRGAEFILIYDKDSSNYKMLNRINLKVKREYDNFINMIVDLYNI